MALMAGVVLTGCKDDPDPVVPKTYDATIDMPATVALENGQSGTTVTFDINANIDWTAEVTEGAEWCSIAPENGTGDENNAPAENPTKTTITVTANELNSFAEARTATITVTQTLEEGSTATPIKKTITVTQPAVTEHDVYIVGYETLSASTRRIMTVYKNGTEEKFAFSDDIANTYALALAVSGNKFYACGYTAIGTVSTANVWEYDMTAKTYTSTPYTNPFEASKNSRALSVAVSGTDVYVAGYVMSNTSPSYKVATLWKNGTPTYLIEGDPTKPTGNSEASCVFVSGSDVYVSGFVPFEEESKAGYWKNGTWTALTDGLNGSDTGRSIFVKGTDVYVCGECKLRPVYWKNGAKTELLENMGYAYSIYVQGNDIYVAGQTPGATGQNATYWKNSTMIVLDNGFDAWGEAMGIAAWGSNVYICGFNDPEGFRQKNYLWTNGEPTQLSTAIKGQEKTYGICVVPKP